MLSSTTSGLSASSEVGGVCAGVISRAGEGVGVGVGEGAGAGVRWGEVNPWAVTP